MHRMDDNELYHDDPEAYMEWHAKHNQMEHKCKACGRRFTGHFARGPLAICDFCADRAERGEDIYY